MADAILVRRPDRHTLVELRAVGGVDAGRVWALDLGTHTLGADPDNTVVLRGVARQRPVRLTVTADGEVSLSLPCAPSQLVGGFQLRTIRPKDSHAAEDLTELHWPDGAELTVHGTTLRLLRHATAASQESEVPDPAVLATDVIGPGSLIRWTDSAASSRLSLRLGSSEGLSRDGEWIVPGQPCGVDLKRYGVLGISGAPAVSRGLARWLVIQAATFRGPRQLGIRVLADPVAGPAWDWAALLPHLPAYGGADPGSVGKLIDELTARLDAPAGSAETLVVVDRVGILRGVEGVTDLLAKGPEHGVYVICVDDAEEPAPEFRAVARCSTTELALTARNHPEQERGGITPDLVSAEWCARAARALRAHDSVS
jgi:S-DNA-T family DNA segregation ATPase FtsK/SpoIIIE